MEFSTELEDCKLNTLLWQQTYDGQLIGDSTSIELRSGQSGRICLGPNLCTL